MAGRSPGHVGGAERWVPTSARVTLLPGVGAELVRQPTHEPRAPRSSSVPVDPLGTPEMRLVSLR
jgi:hypothetical protein